MSIRDLIRHYIRNYIRNEDIEHDRRRFRRVQLAVTEKAARDLHRAAEATGDTDTEARSRKALAEARQLRRSLETQYDLYARRGHGSQGSAR